jgi:hypothetical protein
VSSAHFMEYDDFCSFPVGNFKSFRSLKRSRCNGRMTPVHVVDHLADHGTCGFFKREWQQCMNKSAETGDKQAPRITHRNTKMLAVAFADRVRVIGEWI